MTKTVFVNEIIENNNGSKTGLIVWNDTIVEDMTILYDDEVQRGIKHLIQNPPHPEGFHLFSRFYQFIVLFKWDTKIGASITLTDHGNSVDNALDEYLQLAEKEWATEDRNDIMKIFEEIRNDNSTAKAEMIIKFHVPHKQN